MNTDVPECEKPLLRAKAQRLILAHVSLEPATPIEIIWKMHARGYVDLPTNTVYVALSRLYAGKFISWRPMVNPIQRPARGYYLTRAGEDVLYEYGTEIIDSMYQKLRERLGPPL